MVAILFGLLTASLLWLIGCTLWSIARPERRLWPPQGERGLIQRVGGVLGPGTNVLVVALAGLGWNSLGLHPALRFGVGGPLFAAGAYFGLGGYFGLGVRQSLGDPGPLVASGPYRYSRNPQYVGAVMGFVGLGLLASSAEGIIAGLMTGFWLLLLPFAEEPWLREQLGARYDEYAARVPRYLWR